MNIGDISRASGLSAKTIRYYEERGLIRPDRARNGYRNFGRSDLQKLVFLARARSLGFSVEECRKLFSLYEDRHRASAEVKKIVRKHLYGIDHEIAKLKTARAILASLSESCHGDERPECPILEGLLTIPDEEI